MALGLLALSTGSSDADASLQPRTSLVSLELASLGTTGNGYQPSISADGRFVAFHDGLVVLVRDLRTRTTVIASRASGPDGAVGRSPWFTPYALVPSISADGRLVAFESAAENLDPDDGNGWSDIFVRDLVTANTTLASRASGPTGASANGFSHDASLSADGRLVAFESRASNLDPGDGERPDRFDATDVFVRELATGTTTLVSRASGPAGADGNKASTAPAISGDGRFVAFSSFASNLDPRDRNDLEDVYVRDMQTATTVLVNQGVRRNRDGIGLGLAGFPAISADGHVVAFPFDGQVFVRNLAAGTTRLVTAGANSSSESPSLSRSGRYVAFSSYATNLQPYFTGRFPDVFVRDLKSRRTVLASRAANRFGTPGNGGAHDPSISADGRLVAFEARASNLHPRDRDRSGDIFMRDLGTMPLGAPPSASCGGRRATVVVLPESWYAGTRNPWPLGGTDADDVIVGSRGRDRLSGGPGRDRICGRGGPDSIRSADGSPDGVNCGPGSDSVLADRLDRLSRCERRIRVRR